MDIKLKDNNKLKLATQLEYIESTGTQYIDTGIKVKSTHTVEATLQGIGNYYASGTSHVLFGGRNYGISNNPCFEAISINSTTLRVSRSTGDIRLNISWGTKITYKATPTQIIVNGITNNVNCPSGEIQQTYVICTIQMSGNSFPTPYCSERIYGFKISENDAVILNLIPAKDLNDVVCLYDTVSETFFYNSGTGNFIAGPEVPSTIIILPNNIYLTTTLYHKNTPNVNGLQLLNGILNYQKSHQDEVKEYYYPTTQLWQDIITEYPDIVQYYNMNHKLCVVICEADDPEQFTEDLLQLFEDYPTVASVIAEHTTLAPIITEWNPIIHSLIDTGYENTLSSIRSTNIIDTGVSGNQDFIVDLDFMFLSRQDNDCVFGHWKNPNQNLIRTGCNNSNSLSMARGTGDIFSTTAYDNVRYKVKGIFKNGDNRFVVNNTTISTNTSTYTSPNTNLYLFAIYIGSDLNEIFGGNVKIYSCKLSDTQNNIIRNFVPFYRNGHYGMLDIHDLSNPTFYPNAGSGEFTYSLEPKNA